MQVQNSEVCLGFLPENWLCTVIFFFWNSIPSRLTAILFGNVLGRAGGFLLVDLVSFSDGKLSAR